MTKAGQENSGVPLLEARGVFKYFGAVTALQDVDLKLFPGEVLGVVGDNGAGKSTFMKVLSGLHPPSEGELLFDGNAVRFLAEQEQRARRRVRGTPAGRPGPRTTERRRPPRMSGPATSAAPPNTKEL